jgi:hypothetical protein
MITFSYLNTPTSIANPSIDRSNSDFDIRHSFTAGVTYCLPTPGWNNIARAALGDMFVELMPLLKSGRC